MHLIITGKVQGVSYRWYAQEKMKELGLTGTMKNLPDGTVEIHVEGEKMKEFLEWCKEGSPAAEVEKVKVISEKKFDP